MNDYRYLKAIIKAIDNLPIHGSSIKEELIDHFSTMYEDLQGSDNARLEITLNNIREMDVTKWNDRQKKKHSLFISVMLIMLCSGFLAYALAGTEETTELQCAVNSEEENMEKEIDLAPYGSPIDSMDISSGFGNRTHTIQKLVRFHKGIDFKAPLGTDVKVVEVGVVMDCGYDKKNGYFVEILHDSEYTTRYCHLQEYFVKKGEKLAKGNIIAKVGSTGLSTAPHLHYEIIKSGNHVNPVEYLKT